MDSVDELVIIERGVPFHRQTKQVDGVLELVGRPTFRSSVNLLKPCSFICVVGNVNLGREEINLGKFITQGLGMIGSAGATKEDLEQVFEWCKTGQLVPVVSCIFPMEDALKAQQNVGKAVGRIVLIPKNTSKL